MFDTSKLLGQLTQGGGSLPSSGGGMLPMSFSGSSAATATSTSTFGTGAESGQTDAGTSSKAAKIYNITMGHGNTPANSTALAQSDTDSGMLSWQKIALYGILALAAIFIVRIFRRG